MLRQGGRLVNRPLGETRTTCEDVGAPRLPSALATGKGRASDARGRSAAGRPAGTSHGQLSGPSVSAESLRV